MIQTITGLRNEVVARSHPAANVFPLMSDDELQELSADIKANGLREPIWRDRQGIIVDGRNRWVACNLAGVECKALTVPNGTNVIAFIISLNLHRRHLKTGQKAAIGAELSNLHDGERTDRRVHSEGRSNDPPSPAVTIKQAAELVGVSEPSVKRAKELKRDAPEAFEAVKRGEMNLGAARKQLKERDGKKPDPAGRRSSRSRKGNANKPRPAVVHLEQAPPDRIAQLQSWLWNGTMRAENFVSGAEAVAQAEQSGSFIDIRHLEIVASFVAEMVAATRAVRAA